VVGGRYHYCASRGGTGPSAVVCWGDTNHGALGDGIAPGGRIDTRLGDVWGGDAQLALGDAVTCALRHGHVSCCGGDDDGSLGPHATHFPADEQAPVDVPLSDVDAGVDVRATQLIAGAGFECVLLESRSVACWGWGAQGSLGFPIAPGEPIDDCTSMGTTLPGAAPPCRRTPTAVELGTGPTARLWSGGFTPIACAQDDTGQTSCWGELLSGNCGVLAGSSHCGTPVHVPVLDHAVEIAMGRLSTCARMADGTITCIGTNELGALGRGTDEPASMPRFDAVYVVGF
jgi:hypothetical protein